MRAARAVARPKPVRRRSVSRVAAPSVVAPRVSPQLVVRDSRVAAGLFSECFEGLSGEREELWALTLDEADGAGELLRLGSGEDGKIQLVAERVLLPILVTGRLSFVLAHNHPSGDPKPSLSDWVSTAELIQQADAYGLELVDHLVMAGGRYASMRDMNEQLFEGT